MDHNTQPKNSLLSAVAQRLQQMLHHETAAEAEPTAAQRTEAKQRAVVQTIQQARPQATTADSSKPAPGEMAERMHNYVTEHIADTELNVTSMANDLHISRTALYAAMHEHYAMTPSNYITQRRLEYACQLLAIGVKASTVATRCGYSDPKYFGKTFKKRYGVLPSRYTGQGGTPVIDL